MAEGVNVRFAGELQRFIQERVGDAGLYASASEYIRDLVRRDYERENQEAAKEEEMRRQAREAVQKQMDTTILELKAKLEKANGEQRARLELEYQEKMGRLTAQLQEKDEKLREAADKKRALSMAQQTRSGHVYIISNVGSFGEDVLKIGMTRRLEPDDRIKELGDASVPFNFDVHAMIRSDDAPALERLLHERFDELRVNKVNYRKEFFRVPIQRLREFVAEKALEAIFTMTAEAREYRETQALEKMTSEERQKYHLHESEADARDE